MLFARKWLIKIGLTEITTKEITGNVGNIQTQNAIFDDRRFCGCLKKVCKLWKFETFPSVIWPQPLKSKSLLIHSQTSGGFLRKFFHLPPLIPQISYS
jgi:hypothetical protein